MVRVRRVRRRVGVVQAWPRGRVAVEPGGRGTIAGDPQPLVGEDVLDRRQPVLRLHGGRGVDVRGVGEVGRRIGRVARWGVGLMAAGEGLVQGRGLDDALVGKLFVRGWYDGKAGRWPFLRCHGRLQTSKRRPIRTVAAALGRLCVLLQPRLDDVSLLVANGDASLQLLSHARILRLEAGR